jgi:hypothetical protein
MKEQIPESSLCMIIIGIIIVVAAVIDILSSNHFVMTGEGANYGVDITTGGIHDSFANFVWEPAVVKVQLN